MIDFPKTLKEAQAYKYGQWAGNPGGYSYIGSLCVYKVSLTGPGPPSFQCQRKNGKGSAGLYCWQHAKMVAE